MCDTKPFCDLCEMLPNGRHVFGCPADDGVPSAAPAADTMREAFETELRRHFDPMQADLYLARDESDNYDLWAVMLAWECYRAAHEAGRQHGPPDDMKQAIVTTVNDAVDAAFERGRQLGMAQARREPMHYNVALTGFAHSAISDDHSPPSDAWFAAIAFAEEFHGITPTQEAGDSDTKEN